MSVKKDLADPILGGLVLAGLLGFRVWEWRRRTAARAA